jgi:DNA polymerase I
VTDPLLHGLNSETHIVAVQHSSDGTMDIYFRESDKLHSKKLDFYPFFFLSDPYYLNGFSQKHWIKELNGNKHFRYLCAFERWSHMWDAVRDVITRYNAGNPAPVQSYSELPILHLRPDPVSQFLIQSGITLFKDMEFNELHRMQLDIETYSKHASTFSNPNKLEDRIILIALSDNRGWEHVINGKHKSEKEMLLELVHIINKHDPDVLEGHNIFGFDLPYILKRCELHGVSLALGRDGSTPSTFDGRMSFAERSVDYTTFEIAGRHVIDTLLLLQGYDTTKRTLESYGLKYAAQHFGFAKPDRTYVTPNRISWYWDNEPDTLTRYASDDVFETRCLSEYLSPSIFYLTQMIPFNFGAAARLGSSAKIESLLLREYIRRRESVPTHDVGMQTTGGYTDIFHTGVLGPILDVDVESLYPSIMLTEKILPKTDSLNVFLPLLESLTQMRLDAKQKMKTANDPNEKAKYDAMQSSYKILINSFYGYLGYVRALFSDYIAADKVTQTGQRILRHLMASISEQNGKVVEVDTDGIFFVPPPDITSETDEQRFVKTITQRLPEGINLAINGRYKSMLSYKMKNYALLSYDNKIKLKGSSLTSRSIEKFARSFIQQCIGCLLHGEIIELHALYVRFHHNITEHKLDIGDFSRTETLKEGEEDYLQTVRDGTRNRSASYEVALAENMKWKTGEKISYYITGNDESVKGFENCKLSEHWDPNFPDENIHYYRKRLDEQAKKLDVFFLPQDFQKIFSLDDLFGFSPEGIEIQTRAVKELGLRETEMTEQESIEPKIWLDEG